MKKIIYFGKPFSFSHIAALKRFGTDCKYIPGYSINETIESVILHPDTIAVVPIENTAGGIIHDTVDILSTEKFLNSNLSIKEQLELNIELYLLSKNKISLDKIKNVYSHEYPLKISEKWIKENLSTTVKLHQLTSTSESAQRIKKENNSCAIASIEAAKHYKLKILSKISGNEKRNITRFFVITQKNLTNQTDNNKHKTSLIFSLKDRIGVLYDALKVFKKYRINLSRILSRPHATKIWEYIFLIEIDGDIKEDKIKKALQEFTKVCLEIHILGSYPTKLI